MLAGLGLEESGRDLGGYNLGLGPRLSWVWFGLV